MPQISLSLTNLSVTANRFDLPWQQGQWAQAGKTFTKAQPPSAKYSRSSAVQPCAHKHNRGHQAAQETSLWDNLNTHGEHVPLFGNPCHQSQLGMKGRMVKVPACLALPTSLEHLSAPYLASAAFHTQGSSLMVMPFLCQWCQERFVWDSEYYFFKWILSMLLL